MSFYIPTFSFFLRVGGSAVAGLILVIVFVAAIAVVSAVFFFVFKAKQKRIQALRQFAAQNGWSFAENAPIQTFQNAESYSLFNHSYRSISGLMTRQHDGGNAYLFDYSYRVRRGKNQKHYAQTIVAFHAPRLRLPYFALYPESFFSFIGELVGCRDIDFATHPAFSKNFKLSGRDEMRIRQIFHPQILSFFETLPNIRIDGGGNYLFVYRHNQTVASENLNAFSATALNVYNLFRR